MNHLRPFQGITWEVPKETTLEIPLKNNSKGSSGNYSLNSYMNFGFFFSQKRVGDILQDFFLEFPQEIPPKISMWVHSRILFINSFRFPQDSPDNIFRWKSQSKSQDISEELLEDFPNESRVISKGTTLCTSEIFPGITTEMLLAEFLLQRFYEILLREFFHMTFHSMTLSKNSFKNFIGNLMTNSM